MNSVGDLVDFEVFHGSRSKIQQPHVPAQGFAEISEVSISPKHHMERKCSRTFVKTYDSSERCASRHMPGSPRTVRYVPGSVSSSEINSMAETETSTLRCCSSDSREVMETETETETLHLITAAPDYRNNLLEHQQLEEDNRLTGDEVDLDLDLDKDSNTSMCSWEEALSHHSLRSQTESQSIQVPSLTLQSEATSVSYHHHYCMDQLKLNRPAGEAYDNWLSAKRRQVQYKQQAARDWKEQQKQNTILRQQLSEQRYREWCKRKTEQSRRRQTQPERNNGHIITPQRTDTDANVRHLHAWELQKLKQAEQRRQQQEMMALRREKEKFQRKQKSEQAFQQWMKNVHQRPKPVPLNQGLKTLRGTVSHIYINPNEWVN
ncbi:coiled-coil domain-containing protein 34 [Drosophila tropicalis]|uniref:coiled-coil domain-containing protein 34 n=1 Tax=Drosophila tropicalis TaxID=46794 RepID=UPI0035AB8E69